MTQFAIPDNVAERLAQRNQPRPAVGLDLMTGFELERWWAAVWRERGLPDPASVTLDEFRSAVAQRNNSQ